MKMKKNKFLTMILIMVAFFFTSCTKDLNVNPIDPLTQTPNNVFTNETAYKEALAKVYAGFALTGQQGGAGNADLQGIDEGFSSYLRTYWDVQELPTDEAIISWNDATIKNFHWQTWAPNDVFLMAIYSRIYFTVAIANEFIRQADKAMGSATGTFATDLVHYKAEARFIRALAYWHAIDLFGNVPFITENDNPGAYFPQRITRANLFTYIESECKAIEPDLVAARQNEYGRADQGADWFLLAELYMNAQVYTGTPRYTDALTYLNKVITAGYTLDHNYAHLFSADNANSPETVFQICFNGTNTQTWGGTTFLISGGFGGNMPTNGLGSWGGMRTIKDFVAKWGINQSSFASNPQYQGPDKRAMFWFDANNGWVWDITDVATFTQGIGVTKWSDLDTLGNTNYSGYNSSFASTNFPMFRLGDAYLMYAEAVIRGGSGGDMATAVGYINALRERAYGNTSGDISASDLTPTQTGLDFILDERGRELYWEGHRRTDLIRFGQFTNGTYVWQWKGNAFNGATVPSYRDLYPIPSQDVAANPNLIQNPGY
jgi:starch-binding outer membrane protein, SusD/RagB family